MRQIAIITLAYGITPLLMALTILLAWWALGALIDFTVAAVAMARREWRAYRAERELERERSRSPEPGSSRSCCPVPSVALSKA